MSVVGELETLGVMKFPSDLRPWSPRTCPAKESCVPASENAQYDPDPADTRMATKNRKLATKPTGLERTLEMKT
jgi:hypothetical protein